MWDMAIFATCSAVILAFCLIAVIFVYTNRKLRRKKRLFAEMSAAKPKSPIYVGSIQPYMPISTIPASLGVSDEQEEPNAKTSLNQS
jgi:hypothetical protein